MDRFGDLGEGGRVWRGQKKVNLGRKWIETEDEGKFSSEKSRAVSAVLLVVAVCQNTLSEIQIHAKVQKTGISDLWNIVPPSFGRPTPGCGPTELPISHLWCPLLVIFAYTSSYSPRIHWHRPGCYVDL